MQSRLLTALQSQEGLRRPSVAPLQPPQRPKDRQIEIIPANLLVIGYAEPQGLSHALQPQQPPTPAAAQGQANHG